MQELENFARAATVGALSTEKTAEACLKLVHKVGEAEDKEIDKLLRALDKAPEEDRAKMLPACVYGCAHCCHLWVAATIPEVIAIAAHIKASRAPEEAGQYLARSRKYSQDFDAAAQGTRRMPCPLLVDNACSVYEVRPNGCRGYTSVNVDPCIKLRYDTSNALNVKIPMVVPIFAVSTVMRRGERFGLQDLKLPDYNVVLGKGLMIALEDPQAPAKYFAGGNVFESARVPVTARPAEP